MRRQAEAVRSGEQGKQRGDMKMCALGLLTLELLNIDTWANSKQVFSMTELTDGGLLTLLVTRVLVLP